jgi:hypothetical protein
MNVTNLTFLTPVTGLRAFRTMAMCALAAWFGAAAHADQFTFRTIDYPGADFTAGTTITPMGEIGGLACAGPSCQGFLYQVGTSPVPVTPPGASSSSGGGIQRGGFLLCGGYCDAPISTCICTTGTPLPPAIPRLGIRRKTYTDRRPYNLRI